MGHASTHLKQWVQSKIPCGSWARSLRRSRLLVVARVADEAVGLGERGRADEAGVHLHRQAVRDARAALDAGHRLGDVDHRLAGDDVLALGHGLLGEQPGGDAPDLLPVDRVHVDDQVLDDGHVAHRLDLDHAVARAELLAASRWVWQASAGSPLTRTPQEPQIAWRQEQRMPIEPSKRSRACRIASSTERWGSSSTVCSSQ